MGHILDLAEIFDNTDYASCTVVSQRSQESGANLWALKKAIKKGDKPFEDPAFPRSKEAIIWPTDVNDDDVPGDSAKAIW